MRKKIRKKSKKKSKKLPGSRPSGRRIASIDVGSNGIRLVVCELQKNSQLRTIFSTRAGVRLGRDVFRDGYIREPTARKALRAFIKFSKIMKRLKVRDYRAVATSAVRDSFNGKDFVRYLKLRSGFNLEVISGEKEGRLIHTAVGSKINLINSIALLIDIGGGSVELSLSRFGRLEAVKTFPLGAVRLVNLTDMYLGKSKSKVIEKFLRERSGDMRRFLKKNLKTARDFVFIGTGGNIEALGELRMSLLGKNSLHHMTYTELRNLVRILSSYSYDERISKLDLRPDRADVILPGALALLMVMKLSNAKEIRIPKVGLKDGVTIEVARSIT